MRPALTFSTRGAKTSTCLFSQCEIERSRTFLTCGTRANLIKRPQLPSLWLLITRSHSTKVTSTTNKQQNSRKFHPRYMNKYMNLDDLLGYLPKSSLTPKEIFKSLRTALYNTTEYDDEKAWLIYQSMVQHGVDKYLKPNNYGYLLCLLKYGESISPMMTVLENMKNHSNEEPTPNSYHISQILFAMSRHGLVYEACDIIRLTTMNATKFDDKKLLPTANHYHSLAIALKNSPDKNLKTIEKVTRILMEAIERDTIIFNTTLASMLSFLSVQQDLKLEFLQAMDKMNSRNQKSDKIPYNVFIYTALITGFARQGDAESAKRLFIEMKRHKVTPNQVTYSALMEAYGKAGQFHSAVNLLANFRKKYKQVTSAIVTSLLVNAIRYNNLAVAEGTVKFISENKINGQDVDMQLKTALIWLEAKRNVDEARKKFDKLYETDINLVNSIMANHLIHGYGLKEDKDNVIECFNISHTLPSTGTTLQQLRSKHHLTQALFRCRDVPAALSVFASMRDKAIPDDITMAMVVQGLILNNERNLAWRLFKTLQSEGIEPNLHAYTSILKLHGHRESDLKKKTGNSNINSDIIAKAGIKLPQLDYLHSSVPSTTEALSVFRRMTGFQKPNVYTYTTLISCFAKHDISRAVSIFDHMCAKGVNPTVETYTAILQGCSIFRNSQVALHVFNHMCEKRIEPNEVTWRYLLKSLLRSRVDKSEIQKIADMAKKSLDKKVD